MQFLTFLFVLFVSIVTLRKMFYQQYKDGIIGSGDLIIAHILGIPILFAIFYILGSIAWKALSQMLQ